MNSNCTRLLKPEEREATSSSSKVLSCLLCPRPLAGRARSDSEAGEGFLPRSGTDQEGNLGDWQR